ncbi:MAG: 2-polyprenyl-3-methyl-6-methoxy-1,4-benzoquinone monooxygenase [Pseudomonadota bacterium]
MLRHYNLLDRLLVETDKALRTIYARPMGSGRKNPADAVTEFSELSDSERKQSARLMRINHAGEVSAQGLYQGQSLTARDPTIAKQMKQSAVEENDHLVWCDQRLEELGSHKSMLGPVWYLGSFTIGAFAGLIGDRWSLGFVKETEHKVVNHLDDHLQRISDSDLESRAILEQMKTDELHHAHVASSAGAANLPGPVRGLMTLASKVMTKTAYWV